MTKTKQMMAEKVMPQRGQGTVFVRPPASILLVGRMNILILLLPVTLAICPQAQATDRRWLNGELFEGVPFRHWPVWSRPGNDNIISRLRWWAGNVA